MLMQLGNIYMNKKAGYLFPSSYLRYAEMAIFSTFAEC